MVGEHLRVRFSDDNHRHQGTFAPIPQSKWKSIIGSAETGTEKISQTGPGGIG